MFFDLLECSHRDFWRTVGDFATTAQLMLSWRTDQFSETTWAELRRN